MNSYFEVGVRYDKTMKDGVVRKVTEKPFGCPHFHRSGKACH